MANSKPIKFLCSYGGRIIPRYPDGKLRYQGGETRILSVDSSVTFSDLMVKMGEMCGSQVSFFRCQLPTEDLDDALVSIKSDEDLKNLVEEYHRSIIINDSTLSTSSSSSSSSPIKIRSFLSFSKAPEKKAASPPPPASAAQTRSDEFFCAGAPPRPMACLNRASPSGAKAVGKVVGSSHSSCRHNHQYGGGGGGGDGCALVRRGRYCQ